MENLLNVNQAAFILKVHPLTIRRYIREKRLKAIKAGGNVRIKENDLLEFNKDYTPTRNEEKTFIRTKIRPVLSFSVDDPFLRLKGRGASLTLS
jgi:excisionase family DNA binding protein